MSLNWDFSDILSCGYGFLVEIPQREIAIFITCQEHILSTWLITIDADHYHLTEIVFARFLLFQTVLFVQPTHKEWGFCSTSLRVYYLHKLLEILHGRFVYSSPFISSLNHLFIAEWTHGYFILWVTIQYNLILFLKLFPWKLFQLAPMSLWNIICPVIVGVCLSVCYERFLTSCHCKIVQHHLLYFLLWSQNQLFLEGTLVPIIGEWY